MSTLDSENRGRKLPASVIILLLAVAGLAAAAYYLAPRFEREAPQITLPQADALGLAPM